MSIYVPGGLVKKNSKGELMRQRLDVPFDKIEAYQKAFNLIDADGSGIISAPEVYQFFEDIGSKITYKEVENMINEIDKDGNGELEFEEFISVMEKINEQKDAEDHEIYKAFQQFDVNSRGYMSILELKSIVMNMAGGITEKEFADFLFESGYKKGDEINYKGFVKSWLNRWNRNGEEEYDDYY